MCRYWLSFETFSAKPKKEDVECNFRRFFVTGTTFTSKQPENNDYMYGIYSPFLSQIKTLSKPKKRVRI